MIGSIALPLLLSLYYFVVSAASYFNREEFKSVCQDGRFCEIRSYFSRFGLEAALQPGGIDKLRCFLGILHKDGGYYAKDIFLDEYWAPFLRISNLETIWPCASAMERYGDLFCKAACVGVREAVSTLDFGKFDYFFESSRFRCEPSDIKTAGVVGWTESFKKELTEIAPFFLQLQEKREHTFIRLALARHGFEWSLWCPDAGKFRYCLGIWNIQHNNEAKEIVLKNWDKFVSRAGDLNTIKPFFSAIEENDKFVSIVQPIVRLSIECAFQSGKIDCFEYFLRKLKTDNNYEFVKGVVLKNAPPLKRDSMATEAIIHPVALNCLGWAMRNVDFEGFKHFLDLLDGYSGPVDIIAFIQANWPLPTDDVSVVHLFCSEIEQKFNLTLPTNPHLGSDSHGTLLSGKRQRASALDTDALQPPIKERDRKFLKEIIDELRGPKRPEDIKAAILGIWKKHNGLYYHGCDLRTIRWLFLHMEQEGNQLFTRPILQAMALAHLRGSIIGSDPERLEKFEFFVGILNGYEHPERVEQVILEGVKEICERYTSEAEQFFPVLKECVDNEVYASALRSGFVSAVLRHRINLTSLLLTELASSGIDVSESTDRTRAISDAFIVSCKEDYEDFAKFSLEKLVPLLKPEAGIELKKRGYEIAVAKPHSQVSGLIWDSFTWLEKCLYFVGV